MQSRMIIQSLFIKKVKNVLAFFQAHGQVQREEGGFCSKIKNPQALQLYGLDLRGKVIFIEELQWHRN